VRYVKDGKNIYYTLDDDHVVKLLDAATEHIHHT
jgi:DNA-binding transcriptional ArsR family regulator